MAGPVTFSVLGAGFRGLESYGGCAERFPEDAKIVAVAEPRDWFREEAVRRHNIPRKNVFSDWRELVEQPKLSDAAIIATPDRMHTEPALACIKKGYDILLEKPMAPTEEECRTIVAKAVEAGVLLAVCHVLRYTPYFRKIKEIVSSGVLGQLATVRHMEQIGFWHHAHSYVRGNSRNEAVSSPMILAKSCHDLDILLYLLGRRCLRLSSFGNLSHFHSGNRPKEATECCLDCPFAADRCPYSSIAFYGDLLQKGEHQWPLSMVTQDFTQKGLEKALREGSYGRCVYQSDNDQVDHQVVAMEFEGGISATFTMNAFTAIEDRATDIFGSYGELRGDGNIIRVTDFQSGRINTYDFHDTPETEGCHKGGDNGMIADFVRAVRNRDPEQLTTGPEISLASHVMAFRAEVARKNNTVEGIII